MKYIVSADTYRYNYGCEITFFGIFDTREEAINWIVEHPVVDGFDFFEAYSEIRTIFINLITGEREHPKRGELNKYTTKEISVSKEEYAVRFVKEFDGAPIILGGYQE